LEVLTVVHRNDPGAAGRRRRLGAAIRRYRGGLSQADLAYVLSVSQAGVSLWESGGVDFSYEQVRAIEQVLGLPLGTLGRLAGYAAPATAMAPLTMFVETFDDVLEVMCAATVLGWKVAQVERTEPSPSGGEQWAVVLDGSAAVVIPPGGDG
jgi:transcriptional regulator with XRE-family HTH domain